MIDLKIESARPGKVGVTLSMNGSSDDLLDELASGAASVIMEIADDLPVVDDIHENLARVMTSRMIDHVRMELDLRGQAEDKPPEA